MIARHDTHTEKADIWTQLAEPLPNGVISWRQDGKVIARDGKFFARFVCFIEANTARERLDNVVPGEWDLTLELLPQLPLDEGDNLAACAFKARLQILGVIREDVGTGRDYKAAATDAFKRASVRFGIAHELYAYEQNWVQVDGDSRFPKPLEDPGVVYERRFGAANGNGGQQATARPTQAQETRTATPKASTNGGQRAAPPSQSSDDGPEDREYGGDDEQGNGARTDGDDHPLCPKCDGRMWDNRLTKRNPKAPDYKCRDRSCDGVVWPAKPDAKKSTGEGNRKVAARSKAKEPVSMDSHPLGDTLDDLPF
jgi:hypothetical protein